MLPVSYKSYGKGPITLVLLHGWGFDKSIWHPFAMCLAKKYHVLTVDLPGCGESDLSGQDYTLSSLSKAITHTIQQPCIWLGWSLGGMLALHLAKHFPDQTLGLATIASNPKFVSSDDWSTGVDGAVFSQFSENLNEDHAGTLARFMLLQTRGLCEPKKWLRTLREQKPQVQLDALKGGLSVLLENDLRSTYREVKCPILSILGSRDTLVPGRVSDALKALNPVANIAVIDKAAHMPFMTHQETTLTLIDGFIDEHLI